MGQLVYVYDFGLQINGEKEVPFINNAITVTKVIPGIEVFLSSYIFLLNRNFEPKLYFIIYFNAYIYKIILFSEN